MPNIIDILARAQSLMNETALNSITPPRAGGIMYDTLLVLNQMQLEGASLLISKVYASVSAMEADTTPTSDLTGRVLKPGQLVVIVTSDASSSDMGSEYRYNGPGSWTYVGKVGGLPLDTVPTEGSTKGVTSGGVYGELSTLAADETKIKDTVNDSYLVDNFTKEVVDFSTATLRNYIINDTNKYGVSTSYKHAIIQVSEGDVVDVSSNSSYEARIGFVKDMSAPTNAGDIPVVTGTTVVYIPVNKSKRFIVPAGAVAAVVNYGGSGGGSAPSAMTVYRKKVALVPGNRVLTGIVANGYSGSGASLSLSSGYYGVAFPVKTGKNYLIDVSNAGTGAKYYGFLPMVADGVSFTSRDNESKQNAHFVLTAPANGYFLLTKSNNSFTVSVIELGIPVVEGDERDTAMELVYDKKEESSYSKRNYMILDATGLYGTDNSYKHIIIPVSKGNYVKVTASESYNARVAFFTNNDAPVSGGMPPFADGTGMVTLDPGTTVILKVPSGASYMYVYWGTSGAAFPDFVGITSSDATFPDVSAIQKELDEMNFLSEKGYPFESGSIKGAQVGDLEYLENTARLRVDVPVKNVAAVRIVKQGWGIVAWAVYEGAIPTANRSGNSYGTVADRVDAVEIAEHISSSELSFSPKRFIMVIAKDDDSDISATTTVDDIVQFDPLERSLSGREVAVLGDSSCDVDARDCWAKVLQGRAAAMGVSGFFPGKGGSGWSTDLATPNANGQWENIRSGVESLRPVIIITTGGNEISNLQLSYEDTIALCKQAITTPANASEWAVYTLRNIVSDKPMARIYLVSNFYASSTETKDDQRRTYLEMLRALCDYFSITLIDLTRNSQIRGYLENTSGSPGYHLYTPDGTHATEVNGRYLIYSKIMGFVCREEKGNV